ncbi:hypothetical protein ACLB2K_001673 [Fragaria x ananassa]
MLDPPLVKLPEGYNHRYLRPQETKFLSVNLLYQFLSKGFFKSRSWNCWSNVGHQCAGKEFLCRKQCTADVKWWQLLVLETHVRTNDDAFMLPECLKVAGVQYSLTEMDFTLSQLQSLVSGLDWKICSLEDKQDFVNMGVAYLCNFVSGKKVEMPGALQKQLKLSDNARNSRLLSYSEPSMMWLTEIADSLSVHLSTDGIVQDDIAKLEQPPKKETETIL